MLARKMYGSWGVRVGRTRSGLEEWLAGHDCGWGGLRVVFSLAVVHVQWPVEASLAPLKAYYVLNRLSHGVRRQEKSEEYGDSSSPTIACRARVAAACFIRPAVSGAIGCAVHRASGARGRLAELPGCKQLQGCPSEPSRLLNR